MSLKKILALILVVVVVCSSLVSCSKNKKIEPAGEVVVATDDDDKESVVIDPASQVAFEIVDNMGNTLKLIPVYAADGVTVIAGYVESAKDKNGVDLTAESFKYMQNVIALDLNKEDSSVVIVYNEDNSFVVIDALADENGYIIALKDTRDWDGDKDVNEYFQTLTKFDAEGNILIKLDKDDNGALINVVVATDQDGKQTVTDSKGNTIKATKTENSKNIVDVQKDEANKNPNGSQQSGQQNNSTGNNNDTPPPTEPEEVIDYTAIVLKKNGTIACDASNVSVTGSMASGGVEVVVDGAGEFSKYYITSETDVFSGQIEFRFSIGDDVEVKFNDVNISTAKKTAVKFTDVDKENNKENDSEESGAGTGNSGSSVDVAAPVVELSLTGDNYFKAAGSGKNGTIYSECKIGIKGHGSATIDGGQNLSGICSTESISIKNATLNITSNAKQGISCDRKLTINEGANITIKSLGDCIHCNKFELNGESTLNLSSLYSTNCADGIDANDWVIINAGTLNVEALTPGKYGIKVRKIEKGTGGSFEINGGSVTAKGYYNSAPTVNSAGANLIRTSG